MLSNKNPAPHTARNLLFVIGSALLLYAVLPQIHAFKSSLGLLMHVTAAPLFAAVSASLLALIAAAAKYRVLALRPIRFSASLAVQLASLLTNRLLPAGIGGMGINYIFLRKTRHTKSQAVVVVTMNTLLGLVGHMLLLGVLLTRARNTGVLLATHIHMQEVIAAGALLCMTLLVLWRFKRRAQNGILQFLASLRSYAKYPLKLLLGTLYAVLIALAYVACLWYCAQALHVGLSFIDSLIVLTAGVAASTVTPTPGGLVGVEAAIVAGLIAYHVRAADALAIALLYRLITYWFSMLLGGVALWYARAKNLL